MLVMSREAGESVYVGRGNEACLVTVRKIRGDEVWLIFAFSTVKEPGLLDCRSQQMRLDTTHRVSEEIQIDVVDIRGEKVRLGITAPRDAEVHRFEVYEAIRRENKRAADLKSKSIDPDDPFDTGPGGAPVPAPTKPLPPSLDSHAKPLRTDDLD